MPKYLTPGDFKKLVSKKEYLSEEELEREVMSKLADLLKVKPSQIENQVTTTSFDKTLSNCCDIVVRSDEEIPHVIYVIEIKRDSMVEKYHQGDYLNAVKQLHKYCQDVRSPYGILLTETVCIAYEHRYYKQNYKPDKIQKIPYPSQIEDKITQRSFIEAFLHKSSLKYIYILMIILALYFFISTRFFRLFFNHKLTYIYPPNPTLIIINPSKYYNLIKEFSQKNNINIEVAHNETLFYQQNPTIPAAFHPDTNTVSINQDYFDNSVPGRDKNLLLITLAHEITHAMQEKTNPEMSIEEKEYEANLTSLPIEYSGTEQTTNKKNLGNLVFSSINNSVQLWGKQGKKIREEWYQPKNLLTKVDGIQ